MVKIQFVYLGRFVVIWRNYEEILVARYSHASMASDMYIKIATIEILKTIIFANMQCAFLHGYLFCLLTSSKGTASQQDGRALALWAGKLLGPAEGSSILLSFKEKLQSWSCAV